jgi:hypothetical protein
MEYMADWGTPLHLGCHEGKGTHYGVPRSTARAGRGMGDNGLDGTLPAELGKLTDLESLCAALRRRRCAAIGGPVGAARMRCAGVQRM